MGRAPAEERIGRVVAGKYRVDRVIASGGMGTVYAATHQTTQRVVAIKILHEEYAASDNVVRRFEREARAAGQLDHPNVVDVIDIGQDAGVVYLIMELIEGQTLHQLLRKEKRLSIERMLRILLPVMDALHRAHQLEIVHRDLKPENVMIVECGSELRSILLDFGIAKLLDTSRTQLTMKGTLIGTAQYMSPEQLIDTGNVGPKSDVWAMGVLIYQCLSGALPYDGPHPIAISGAVLDAAPPSVLLRDTDVPPELTKVLDRALVRNLEERYPDMACLAAALLKVVEPMDVDVSAIRHPATPMALTHIEAMGPRIIEVNATLPYAPAMRSHPPEPMVTPTRPSFPSLPGKDDPARRMAFLTGIGLSLVGALAVLFALIFFAWHHLRGADVAESPSSVGAPATDLAIDALPDPPVGAPIPEGVDEHSVPAPSPHAVQLAVEEPEAEVTPPVAEPHPHHRRQVRELVP